MPNTNLVILGATGDLTQRLLMPALYRLYCLGYARGLKITGYSIEGWSRTRFQNHILKALRAFAPDYVATEARRFSAGLDYVSGGLNAKEMAGLSQKIKGAALFYLALPPPLFGTAAVALGQAGLTQSGKDWRRLVVEKPFGTDLASAEALRKQIHTEWDEQNVLRIDHFLGKETTQNLLVFRFANRFLEPLWNSAHIAQVQIGCPETLGVEHRAAYYDHAGALRDMLQNHLMQLFCYTAMEPPSSWDAEVLRDHKVEVLRAVVPYTAQSVRRFTARGQYAAGHIGRKRVPAYRKEPGIPRTSTTETFAALRFEVNNWRWQGVPFYLRSGKRLVSSQWEIAVQFKQVPDALPGGRTVANNWMIFRMQPNASLNLLATAKKPGAELDAHQVVLTTPYARDPDKEFSAYEQLLLDALSGDRSHFLRFDEVEWAWRLLDPVLKAWRHGQPDPYASGSEGPQSQNRLLAPGHAWRSMSQPDDEVV
ncbi:MAG: glucose-6-phosphate dehydrogenase [Gammaproteobacteria bacterium]